MTQTIGYNKSNFWIPPLVFTLVIIAAFYRGEFNLTHTLIVAAFGLYYTIQRLLPLCTVTITDDDIQFRYLLPLRRNRIIQHTNVASYTPIKCNPIRPSKPLLFGGSITTTNPNRSIPLFRDAVADFPALNNALTQLYPQYQDGHASSAAPSQQTT